MVWQINALNPKLSAMLQKATLHARDMVTASLFLLIWLKITAQLSFTHNGQPAIAVMVTQSVLTAHADTLSATAHPQLSAQLVTLNVSTTLAYQMTLHARLTSLLATLKLSDAQQWNAKLPLTNVQAELLALLVNLSVSPITAVSHLLLNADLLPRAAHQLKLPASEPLQLSAQVEFASIPSLAAQRLLHQEDFSPTIPLPSRFPMEAALLQPRDALEVNVSSVKSFVQRFLTAHSTLSDALITLAPLLLPFATMLSAVVLPQFNAGTACALMMMPTAQQDHLALTPSQSNATTEPALPLLVNAVTTFLALSTFQSDATLAIVD
mmetsp:Transcript_34014/g.39651  ORF Transcript_34014/g.39651 Transcript_34014/m.39651 type:complete len:324 (+) Transcript_34014:183-1154(+)